MKIVVAGTGYVGLSIVTFLEQYYQVMSVNDLSFDYGSYCLPILGCSSKYGVNLVEPNKTRKNYIRM